MSEEPTAKFDKVTNESVSEVIFPDGLPAVVRCTKCSAVEPVVVMRMERRVEVNMIRSRLVVASWVMPSLWTQIDISEVQNFAHKVVRTVYACPNCMIEIG